MSEQPPGRRRLGPLWRSLWAAAAGVGALMLVFFLIPRDTFRPERTALDWTSFFLAITILAALIMAQIRAIILDRAGGRSALGLPVLVALALVVFATAYQALSRQPGEFRGLGTRTDALYFTIVTMATVGYGDIVPTGQTARTIVMIQIVYGFVFLGAAATAFGSHLRGRVSSRTPGRDAPPERPGR